MVEFIKTAHHASSEFEYEMVMVGMIKKIKDSHAFISKGFDKIRERIGNFVPPVLAKYVEGQVVVTDFYAANKEQLTELKAASNLQVGDVITHIEDKAVADLIEEGKQFYSASNDSKLMQSVTAGLLRSSEQKIKVDLLRDGKKESVLLPLYKQEELDYTWSKRPKKGPSVKTIEEGITYYWLETLEQEDLKKIEGMLLNSKGFIADLRGYPQTNAESWKVFTNMLEKPTSLLSWVSKQSSTPGEFKQGLSAKYPNAKNTYRGPVVVLVDANTQSFSESLAMGFQAGVNTITMGTQTSGANGQGSYSFSLPGGLYTIFSGSGAYYTDGTQMQQVGVKIDKIVEPTVKGIREGRDEVLEAAIAYIEQVSKQQTQVSPSPKYRHDKKRFLVGSAFFVH